MSKGYPTQFYGRTGQYWLIALFVVFPAICICSITAVMILLGLFGIIHGVKSPFDSDVIYGVIIFIFFILLAIAVTFQLCVRQRPILKIYREGLWIRTIWTSSRINPILGCLLGIAFGFILTVLLKTFIMVWHVITLQAFRIQTVRLRWENIDILPKDSAFTFTGWCEKEYDDFGQDIPLEYCTVDYQADSFGTSIDKVIEGVQFFLHNPDEREMLPSWQEEDSRFGNGTFEFDKL